jgi:carboxypeptidase C (cathepsin A)
MSENKKGNQKFDVKVEMEKPKSPPEEELVETKHSSTINGEDIAYTVNVGTIIIKEEEEKKEPQAKASIFFIAYTRDNKKMEKRPLTFSFNGGPGSSSVWLHLGVLGPYRVIAEKDAQPVSPPYRLVNNEYSLLDVTDLVFIDPVSTGYSRAVPGEKNKKFHEFKQDIKTVAEFIRLYSSRYKRWTSPKFVIGESYGTTRAAGLAGHLQKELACLFLQFLTFKQLDLYLVMIFPMFFSFQLILRRHGIIINLQKIFKPTYSIPFQKYLNSLQMNIL